MRGIVLAAMILSATPARGAVVQHLAHPVEPVVSERGLVSVDGAQMPLEYGRPQVPYVCYRFVIPYGERLDEVTVVLSGYREMAGTVDIDPAQPPAPIGYPAAIAPRDQDVYSQDKLYPDRDFELVGVERLAGVDLATVRVYPYRFSPVRRKLGYFETAKITLETAPDQTVAGGQEHMICRSPSIDARLASLVVNPSAVKTYPSAVPAVGSRDLVGPEDAARFLIVCGQAYENLFLDYAAWKETHGVSAAVFAIEDILAEYTSGVDAAANLRDFIIDAYQAWAATDDPLEYVLLAGDDEIIPIRGCWGWTEYFGTDNNIPCDLYYACLDGNWDASGNGIYGEVADDPDLLAEVHVGRFPGDNFQDFQNMINKTQHYVDDGWPDVHTALMVGELISSDPLYWGAEWLDLIADDPQYMPSEYTVTKMYQRDGTFSTSNVTQHVNANGSALIYHCAHTHFYYLLGWSQTDIDNLQNTEYPFFSAGGCHTMGMDQAMSGAAESVGEHALTASAGMVAFLGNSRYGFTNWTDFVQELMVGVHTEGIGSIGASLTYARDQLVHLVGNEIWRWEYYELIFAGDPEIHMVPPPGCCIAPVRGDVQLDGAPGETGVDISDLVYLVNYMFKQGPEPPCWPEADVNATGVEAVDVADLVYLVNYMFKEGPAPAACP